MVTQIREAVRWLWGHRLLRTLAVMVAVMNLSVAGCIAVLVLFAQDILGLGSITYGLLLAGLAVGGVAGGLLTARLRKLFGTGPLLIAMVVSTSVLMAAVGVSSNAWLVAALLTVLGVPMVAWNVSTVSLRQAIVPDHLFGRVNSIYKLLAMGSMPLGGLLGGAAGHAWGLRAPFFVGGALVAVMAALALPTVRRTVALAATTPAASTQR